MCDYLLAYDLGTTGVKASLITTEGHLLASAFGPYTTERTCFGYAEQSPIAWWDAVCKASHDLRNLHPEAMADIAAVGLCGMMNGAVLVDANGRVIRPALIHADIRSQANCDAIATRISPERVADITGNRLAPFFTLSKLAWLTEHEPGVVREARWCIQAKDYIAGRLSGVFGVTDPSDASLTGMFDMRRLSWSHELLSAANIDGSILPEVVASTTILGGVTRIAAEQTGLRVGTPVVLGGGDGACATAGAGAIVPGDAYHYLGGTSWIGVVTDPYTPDPQARISTFCGFGPAHYVNYGTVQSAGSSIEWFLQTIGAEGAPTDQYSALASLAAQSPVGSRGLYFLPYLQGERSPIWNTNARGAFIGLSAAHNRSDMARAVHEGVAFALRSVLDVHAELGSAPETVRVLGGGMRSILWRSIFADIYGRPLQVLEQLSESTSRGAAIAAGMAVSAITDWSAARNFAHVATTEAPDPERSQLYSQIRKRFDALYPLLAQFYNECAADSQPS